MAANDYFDGSSMRSPTRSTHRTSGTLSPMSPQFKALPPDPYAAYTPHHVQPPAPHMSSPYERQSYEQDTGYHPWADQSQQASPYHAGGREQDPNPFADDIPLRQNPSKGSSDVMPLQYSDDPAIVDRRPDKNDRRRTVPWYKSRIPWVVYILTTIQISVFIAELSKNGVLTKTPIEVHPQFNPMIGPSPYVLINMGARYVPCMRKTPQGQDTTIEWPCPNTTSSDLSNPSNQCTLNQLCGFGDEAYTGTSPPNQYFRFIIPMFLHAGIIHISFNMLLQLLLGREMELEIGPLRFIIVYLSSGIFGFVLGGNFAPEGIASTGASGSLFGIIALMLLDLFYHWAERRSPWVDLAWLMFDIIVSFVLGLLPGLDNFSHIGGFLMGLILGICLLHSPDPLRRRLSLDEPAYASARHARQAEAGIKGVLKDPVGFFKGRKPLWWAWWLVRAGMLVLAFAVFIILIKNFYKVNPTTCHWCRYLSCIDIKNWCDIGQLTTTNQTSPSKRDLFTGPLPINLQDLV